MRLALVSGAFPETTFTKIIQTRKDEETYVRTNVRPVTSAPFYQVSFLRFMR